MNRNTDVVAQGLAAIGPFKLFIAARRRDADEEAAKMHPKASATPPAPFLGSGSGAPLPVATSAEVEETVPETPPALPRAGDVAPHSGSEIGVTPKVQATPAPRTPSPPTEPPSMTPETALATTNTTRNAAEEAIPQTGPSNTTRVATEDATPQAGLSGVPPAPEEVSGTDASEATALAEPITVEAAMAQFEAIWHMSQPEKLPVMVQKAYAGRDRDPGAFAQKLIGAGMGGFLLPALEAAVVTLIRVDPHFQAAHLLSRKPDYAPLFAIDLEEEDYHADDSTLQGEADRPEDSTLRGEADHADENTLPGEADRAALRGDSPF
jgi:hypothetical protein